MEVRFRTNKLREMYKVERVSQRELGKSLARRYVAAVDTMREATSLHELQAIPWLRCHALKGDRAGQWSVSLNRFHRLIFEIIDEVPEVIRIEEISKHYGD